jgi:hypothetical protein
MGTGVLGVGAVVLTVGFVLDFGCRKNELADAGPGGQDEGLTLHFVQVAEGYGMGSSFVKGGGLAGGDAFCLEFLELAHRFQALFNAVPRVVWPES